MLFCRHTLPSIRAQSVPCEAWLIADPELEEHHQWEHLYPGMRMVYDPDAEARELGLEGEMVYWMRVDSDDMIAPDAVERLTRGLPLGWFSQLDHGVAFDPETETLYRWRNPSPPFYGRMCSSEELLSGAPSLGHHGRIRDSQWCVVVRTDEPAFCVLLHGGNISNRVEGPWCKEPIVGDEAIRIRMKWGLL